MCMYVWSLNCSKFPLRTLREAKSGGAEEIKLEETVEMSCAEPS